MLPAGEFGPTPAHTVIVDEILCKTCRTFFLVPVSKYEKLTNEKGQLWFGYKVLEIMEESLNQLSQQWQGITNGGPTMLPYTYALYNTIEI